MYSNEFQLGNTQKEYRMKSKQRTMKGKLCKESAERLRNRSLVLQSLCQGNEKGVVIPADRWAQLPKKATSTTKSSVGATLGKSKLALELISFHI